MKTVRLESRLAVLAVSMLLAACAATAPAPDTTGGSAGANPDLTCTISSNCVNSLGTGGMAPLRYVGVPEQAMAMLRATLGTFPEASIVRSEPLKIEVGFTTPAGFRDQVDFRIDPQAQRVDFRSRSLFGVFDWGKNRSRMQEFTARFEQQARR